MSRKIEELDSVRATVSELQKILQEKNEQIKELQLHVADSRRTSYDGIMIWKIINYRQKLMLVRENRGPTSFYSQPFYTNYYGYKLCARIYLNGDGSGRGSHVSLFIVIMQGEYDDILPWPFALKVTLVLLDQSVNRKHHVESFRPESKSSSFQKPKEQMNVACGCPQFVSHAVLENATDSADSEGRVFVQNDIVYFKIMVDPLDVRSI